MGIFKNIKGNKKPVITPVGPPVDSIIDNNIDNIEPEVPEPVVEKPKALTTAEKLASVQKELEDLKRAEEEEEIALEKEKEQESSEETNEQASEITIQQVLENFELRLRKIEYNLRLM
jgi:hypothetical protein